MVVGNNPEKNLRLKKNCPVGERTSSHKRRDDRVEPKKNPLVDEEEKKKTT